MVGKLVRTLRTPNSERFLLLNKSGSDIAALDLHYLQSGKVDGTLILFESANVNDAAIPDILKLIDEDLLPEVKIEDGNLSFTVVRGVVIGNFMAQNQE